MSNPAYLAKEIAAQEAQAKNEKVNAPFIPPQAAVGSQISPSAAGQVNHAQNANLAALTAAQAPAPSVLDLPAEVKANINPHKLEEMELDEMLQRLINSRVQPVDLDRLVPLLWVEFKKTAERSKVQQRLRYLVKHGYITKADGRSLYQRLPTIADNQKKE